MNRIDDFMQRLGMTPHEEGGSFCDALLGTVPSPQQSERQSSGAIYYALKPGETADFHVIDCDEYWCHHIGDTLEVWLIDSNGNLNVELLGQTRDARPLLLIPAGTIFAARHLSGGREGAFVSCITVPKFNYSGWRLLTKDEICELCPKAAAFWN